MDPHTATLAVHNRSRNTRPNHLPVELLTFILQLRFPDTNVYRSEEDMEALYSLRLVSKVWKEVIENIPKLWTYISTCFPMTVIRDSLRRSKTYPLRIKISHSSLSWFDDHPHITPQDLLQLLQLLQPHSYRWNTLDYASGRKRDLVDNKHVTSFLESPAPILQRIHVDLDGFSPVPTVNLAGGQAKTLKHLRLRDVSLPWSSSILHGLETFNLAIKGTVPAEEIINLFVKSPALRRFELDCQGTDGQNNQTAPATGRSDITAHSLEEAVFRTCPHTASQILSQVYMPNCTSLVLSVKFTTLDDIPTLDDTLVQFMPKITDALDLGGRAIMGWSPEGEYQCCNPPEYDEFHFSLEFSGVEPEIPMERIRNLVAASGSQLDLEASFITSDLGAAQMLGGLNEITKLEVVSQMGHHWYEREIQMEEEPAILDFLGNARVDSIDGLSWSFPNLQELDLRPSGYRPIDIFNMFNRRFLPDTYAQSMEGSGLSVHTPPKLDVWVPYPTEPAEMAIVTALKNHWGTKSLNGGEWDDEELEDSE
ncbi:hypothetical protein FRC04_011356 [Tulasnella sp. 424]|nr:hypothetical protein FRC04_011356 [Tulasnella sp. 424]KAG8975475.1 hypothetical protein FRC05_005544 [Tulasnella sp. 425]